MRDDVRRGLTAPRKWLPPTYFYDAEGSRLFDEITRLPEYYPTRRERAALVACAAEIAASTQADTLVEIGSGTSEKTRLLLDALRDVGTLQRFVPFDVDESVLMTAGYAITADYPGVAVHAVVGDFTKHTPLLPVGGRRLLAFLGSTIGNLEPEPRARFLRDVAGNLQDGDAFLLGIDLVKDAGRLQRAYDDAAGVTAAFNRNVLRVLDRELHADADPDAFDHVALWNAEDEWIEMRLRARQAMDVHIGDLDLDVSFTPGEDLRTEISAKFRREGVERELGEAGLVLQRWWTDPAGDVALALATPMGSELAPPA
ncbi:MAG TPA: L-histidine N(alpha)-methyltransferase [Mycobacteriales bacterium]|nr:L-histidine N(alpha)-methyltransferase [Mycobacteriales bacterium]